MMPNQIDLGQTLELRDASGSTLGYFLSAQERKEWERTCQELRQECHRLQAELAKLKGERDQYLKSLYSLTRKPVSFDAEELASMEKNYIRVDELTNELELEVP
ncbi:MAG TPA: hypothetical protein VGY66_15175 [Gemmataceae bacterium]|jgi:uncharacterized protein YlxW (UPF0749 family)|nr:hypothetical protein [Gemmataceae bacterium]